MSKAIKSLSLLLLLLFLFQGCNGKEPEAKAGVKADDQVDVQSDTPRLPSDPEVTPPKKKTHVDPNYPLDEKKAGVDGVVVLEIVVDQKGDVTETDIIRSSGNGNLDDAAVEAVKQWKYEPGVMEGKPVPVKMVIKVRFELGE